MVDKIITLNHYQSEAIETDHHKTFNQVREGLYGECGELASKFYKLDRDFNGEITPEYKRLIMLELGDLMWFIAAVAARLDYSLHEVAQANIEKLRDRQARNVLGGNANCSGDTR